MERILIIGAAGQIGSELVPALRKVYGDLNVFASDIKQASTEIMESGPFDTIDVMDDKKLVHFIIRNNITQIYHLAAVLSGNAERMPLHAWNINMDSLMNILELAREVSIKKIFWPSSMGVFGPSSPHENTPQTTVMDPSTVYGISKLAGERWIQYYNHKYDMDVRSLRYPGLISYQTQPGGGTTDYAIHIFHEAIQHGKYTCFLRGDTKLPMMYMDDAIKATIDLMEAPHENLTVRSSYNVAGVSFSPEEVGTEIQKHIPGFQLEYEPDYRQQIADSWPGTIDDSVARKDWGLKCEFGLPKITELMIEGVKKVLGVF